MKLKGFLALFVLVAALVIILWQTKPIGDQGLMTKIQAIDKARVQATQMNLKALQREIITYMTAHGRLPEDLKQLPQAALLMIDSADAWGSTIEYRRISEDSFHLVSAGQDREFRTADDIVLEY